VLATVAHFGANGWEAYWEQLRLNGVKVVSGWTEAYEGNFTAGGGKGDRPLVVSYASSPPAAVLFGPDPKATAAPTGVVDSTCFRVTEFAGVLKGSSNPVGGQQLIDFLTGKEAQEQLPLNMFVFPANTKAVLPKLFVDFAARPARPLTLTPAEISKGREDWIDAWTKVMQ
jgi:thiamine transport system substrate-binding protein